MRKWQRAAVHVTSRDDTQIQEHTVEGRVWDAIHSATRVKQIVAQSYSHRGAAAWN